MVSTLPLVDGAAVDTLLSTVYCGEFSVGTPMARCKERLVHPGCFGVGWYDLRVLAWGLPSLSSSPMQTSFSSLSSSSSLLFKMSGPLATFLLPSSSNSCLLLLSSSRLRRSRIAFSARLPYAFPGLPLPMEPGEAGDFAAAKKASASSNPSSSSGISPRGGRVTPVRFPTVALPSEALFLRIRCRASKAPPSSVGLRSTASGEDNAPAPRW
mmetsp:Transcript_32212/g.68594  ORF Transcript_32212/g.68594 Transcript_32212/m.68594 type:complete len:212 (+) Transcript_32212:2302-2937(+)